MLPAERLPMPPEWRELLEELAGVFARRSTHRLFMALACGLILADRGTVTGMAAAAGIGRQWRRACWFFAAAKALLAYFRVTGGRPLDVACDHRHARWCGWCRFPVPVPGRRIESSCRCSRGRGRRFPR
jgi:hypothetical protein